MPHDRKLRKMLEGTVDRIIQSYRSHGGINHIEGPSLPSQGEIIRTLEGLVSILFPGFFDTSDITSTNLKYHVGTTCAAVYQQLVDQINKCFRYFCENEARCRPDSLTCAVKRRESCLRKAREIAGHLLRELPEIRRVLHTDVKAAYQGDPAAKSLDEIILAYPGIAAITVYRIAHVLWVKKVPLLPRIMTEYAHARTGIDIHPGATIGEYFMIDHGTGVVIGETTRIGRNVRIYQGVTLGLSACRTTSTSTAGRGGIRPSRTASPSTRAPPSSAARRSSAGAPSSEETSGSRARSHLRPGSSSSRRRPGSAKGRGAPRAAAGVS